MKNDPSLLKTKSYITLFYQATIRRSKPYQKLEEHQEYHGEDQEICLDDMVQRWEKLDDQKVNLMKVSVERI